MTLPRALHLFEGISVKMSTLKSKSKLGRVFVNGKPLSEELRGMIIDELENNFDGNKETLSVSRGAFVQVSKTFRVSQPTVKAIWNKYCTKNMSASINKRSRGRPKKLTNADLDFIEYMKLQKPSATSENIHTELSSVSTTQVVPRTINTAIRSYLPERWTRKKIKYVAKERFTYDNLVYTETYMELLHSVDPYRLQFMDESGFKLPEVCNPLYGHAPRGQRAIEVVRYHSRPNVTLHLLAGLGGVSHCKVTAGASDSLTFINFITECVHSATDYGVTALKPNDILVVDNATIHHSEIAQELKRWLEVRGIDVVYTPKYSPDMNPVEECFSKIKSVIKQPSYNDIVHTNLYTAIYSATKSILSGDMHSFFRHTGYLNC